MKHQSECSPQYPTGTVGNTEYVLLTFMSTFVNGTKAMLLVSYFNRKTAFLTEFMAKINLQ